MKVKKYIVNSLPEAMPIIRKDLGRDAIILNTKEIRMGGFLGLFKKRKMEVIAAVESNVTSKPAASEQSQSIYSPVYNNASSAAPRPTAAEIALAQIEQKSAEQQTTKPSVTVETNLTPPVNSMNKVTESELADEIRKMKKWIVQLTKQQLSNELPETFQQLYDHLITKEVEVSVCEQIIDDIKQMYESESLESLSKTEVWDAARQTIVHKLSQIPSKRISNYTKVVCFVGPTGVGKTTTIAKLAAEQSLKGGKKVGFITSDTYRIAAVEQLRTYANILNIPLEVIFSPTEVNRAFKQLEDREIIFMDTAGRNFQNDLYVAEINSMIRNEETFETYLVLSLTSKYKDIVKVTEQFLKYGISRVLFTKEDETSEVGSIVNLAYQYGLCPSFITTGQAVPEDITVFHVDKYVDKLLGA